jgi:hypothetical protein
MHNYNGSVMPEIKKPLDSKNSRHNNGTDGILRPVK